MVDQLIGVRAIHLASTAIVAGTALFAWFVVEPVWRAVGPPRSSLVTSTRARLVWLLWTSLAISVLTGGAWLLLLAARIGGSSWREVLADGTVIAVLTETQFGQVWELRALCAVLLAGLLLILNPRRNGLGRPGLLVVVLGMLLLGTLAWSGHGGGTPGREGYIHLSADILHLIAVGTWVGGLLPLVLVMHGRFRASQGGSAAEMPRVVRRFSQLGIVSVAILLGSGIVNSWFLVGDIAGLSKTEYGRLLLLKIVLFVVMNGFAAVNRWHLMPQLSKTTVGNGDSNLAAARAIEHNAFIELALGLGVIIIVAVLGILPPAMAFQATGHMH